MTIRPHDFSRPPSLHPETRTKLVQWMTRANSHLSEALGGNPAEFEIQLDDCSTAWPFDELATCSERTVAFRTRLAGTDAAAVLCITNPLAQVIVASFLGEVLPKMPEERDLTPSELSVAEFFVTRVLSCIVDTWSGDKPLDLNIAEQEPNLRRTKVFRLQEPFIVCRTTIRSSVGSGKLCWILPHDYLTTLFGSIRNHGAVSQEATRQQLETLARNMNTNVTIRLGSVQLSAPQLAELRVGDLVVLNQRTSEPLRATISGQTRFLGWPGRVGNRQAFEIATDGPRRERNVETKVNSQPTTVH